MTNAANHAPPRRQAIEWPTLLLAAVIYCGWLAATWFHDSLPVWLFLPLGAWLVAWQTSLQHEIIHGHPTRNRSFNRWLGRWPLILWVPFEIYRITHLIHHRDERLTDPLDDPESNYWTPEEWARLNPARRFIVRVNATLLGRILLGPGWGMTRFLQLEAAKVWRGDRVSRAIWRRYLPELAVVLVWVVVVCGIDPLVYFFGIAYPATSLMMIRSYAEHRAESSVEERTAIVERAPVLGLLFLYNNLHVVHHDSPMLPWYRIPAAYRANRERYLRENGGLVYRGYLDVARRYLVTAHDDPVHPLGRVPVGGEPARRLEVTEAVEATVVPAHLPRPEESALGLAGS